MEKLKKTVRTAPGKGFMTMLLAALIFTSCNQNGSATNSTPGSGSDSTSANGPRSEARIHPFVAVSNVTATVKEEWGGAPTTHANDSVIYHSGLNTYKAFTDAKGVAILSDTNYTPGNGIVMEACANSEICGKVFNQALTTISGDTNLMSSTFIITALATNDSIPVKIMVTDMNGVARSGYSVQFTLNGVNYGSAATTNAGGVATYGKQLNQGSSYSVTATGTSGTSTPLVVSTTPLSGSTGNFSGIRVFIRY